MKYFAGLDIGSTAIKVALVDDNGELAGVHVCPSGSLFHHNAKEALAHLLDELNLDSKLVSYLIATGYGRKLYKEADDSISEITANAIGAHEAGRKFGGVQTIINIGGQDSKAIQIDDEGGVANFVMNDKCSAGTGRFLEVMSLALRVPLNELGKRSLSAKREARINSTCTVFGESEVISLLAAGTPVEEIIAGLHMIVARRVQGMVASLKPAVDTDDTRSVVICGGVAYNCGVVHAVETVLGNNVAVPPNPQIVGALGAALIASDCPEAAKPKTP
jgi:predicted CoA-substrate-specific enzyme activase